MLDDALLSHKPSSLSDSVIIFEDVLYYGIRSDAEGFRKMYQNILYLAENGFHVTIAYYNPLGTPFEQMVKDALIDVKYQNVQQRDIKKHYADVKLINDFLKEIDHAPSSVEYKNTLIKLADNNFQSLYDNDYVPKETSERKLKRINRLREDYTYVDSIFSERYFDSTKITQKVKIEKMMKGYQALIPLGKDTNDIVTIKVNEMCSQLQVAMSKYMSVGINEITYSDFKKMYAEMTDIIISLLKTNPNIELLPLEERLLMSCWLTKVGEYEQAVLAFPSKYTTEEIGFVSQDDAFAKYIHTMMILAAAM